MHPFLQNDFHIRWSILTPDHIEADISKALEDAEIALDAVAQRADSDQPLTYSNTIEALDAALEPLNQAWGKVGHLDSVKNSPEFRKAYNAMLPKVTEFFSGIPLNDKLWATLKAYSEGGNASEQSPTQRRYVAETLADFREQGADLPPEKKQRARDIQNRLAEISQKYSENCLDASNAWEKLVTEESMLSGLPQSTLDAARENAKAKDLGTDEAPVWRFTLQAPSLIPVLTYADSDPLRKEVWTAYNTIGRAEPHDNRPLVREILELRHEFAQLIGKANFADLVTERRMVGSGSAALQFSEDLHKRIVDQFQNEAEQLRSFKAKSADSTSTPIASLLLEPWEAGYWAEKQRKANYDFDEEALRPYFPIDRVISGMFELAQKIFQLQIKERETAEWDANQQTSSELPQVWHPEVKFYELYDDTGQHRGSFYADWHPREPKRGGAWMNYLITGNSAPNTDPTPHLGLICGNLTPSVGGKPALLNHREVETIFHEFGHLLHHLCGDVEVKALNGVNVPWDFVELPSQIMENWCWERESLDLFARHHETSEPIPQELFDKMLAARNYRKASFNIRQLALGKMDLDLHITWPTNDKPDLDDFIETQLAEYAVEYATKPKSNVFNFSHLFSSPTGYASGYYSYKWAEVLDADAFTRFQKEGILNPDTGRDFRAKILAKGNSEDPAKLFQDFMGRDPDPDALLRRDALIN